MITVDLLKNCQHVLPQVIQIWIDVLGKKWLPNIPQTQVFSWFSEWVNESIPLAYVAFYKNVPVGLCSLQFDDDIRLDLKPWIGDLIVDSPYQNQGIGKLLIDAAKPKSKQLGYSNLYLFTFDMKTANYYIKLGWHILDTDEYQGNPVIVMQTNL